MSHHKVRREVTALAEAEGLAVAGVEVTGGSHVRVTIRRSDGLTAPLIVSLTSSDWRAALHIRAQLRRFAKTGAFIHHPLRRGRG